MILVPRIHNSHFIFPLYARFYHMDIWYTYNAPFLENKEFTLLSLLVCSVRLVDTVKKSRTDDKFMVYANKSISNKIIFYA